ncbi:MAG: AraC family ligand binding domain-containing protein [Lachnospiraceae bacterium]
MEEQRPNTERKRDGFRGERMIVLPTEAFSDYVRHPLVRRLYLTDVGFFPSAAHHYRERKEGIEEYIFLYCMDGSGQITVEDRTYTLRGEEAFCIPPEQESLVIMPRKRIPGVFSGSISRRGYGSFSAGGGPGDFFPVAARHRADAVSFELLFRVLEGNYTLGNFIYIFRYFP